MVRMGALGDDGRGRIATPAICRLVGVVMVDNPSGRCSGHRSRDQYGPNPYC